MSVRCMLPALTRLKDRKRAAILDAAEAAFRESGYAAASMDGIACRACVSKRTLYNHFESKEALFAAILQRLWQARAEDGLPDFDPARPVHAQLEALLWQKMHLFADPDFIDLARVMLADTLTTPERAHDMADRLGNLDAPMTRWLQQAADAGALRIDDPAFAARQLAGLLKTFAFWPQVALGHPLPDAAEQQRTVDAACRLFLAGHTAQ